MSAATDGGQIGLWNLTRPDHLLHMDSAKTIVSELGPHAEHAST